MNTQHRAIIELVTIIQPGDVLTLRNGSVHPAEGCPANPADYMQRERGGIASPMRYALWMTGWLVSIHTGTCIMPVHLNAIVAVERGGLLVWSISGERVPVQLAMFDEETRR